MGELDRSDDAEEGSRLSVTDDRRVSEKQVADIQGRQVVSQRRDNIWCPSGVAGRTTRVERHIYDDFLRMDLPAGTSVIDFADEALVLCAIQGVGILELRINEFLW